MWHREQEREFTRIAFFYPLFTAPIGEREGGYRRTRGKRLEIFIRLAPKVQACFKPVSNFEDFMDES